MKYSPLLLLFRFINDIRAETNEKERELNAFQLKSEFPTKIDHYPIRIDHYSDQHVTRGHIEKLGGDIDDLFDENTQKKFSRSEFKRIMQCAPFEPGLDGKRGSLTLLKLVPPSKLSIELIATSIEKRCEPWRECHELLDEARKGKRKFDLKTQNKLIRIMNNKLYYDWPFPYKNRFSNAYFSMLKIVFPLLHKIYDLMDCAFLTTSERSYLKWNVPFPSFVNSPAIHYGDMPWPWIESLETEIQLYRKALKHGFSDQNKYHSYFTKQYKWNEKIPKAAYFGNMMDIRTIFYIQAADRRDIIEAGFLCGYCGFDAIDPASTESRCESQDGRLKHPLPDSQIDKNLMKPGYIQPIISLYKNESVHYDQYGPGKYKYLVVLTGVDGKALSGRLAAFFAHSGAVLLLQDSNMEYHFSARLKPWVHYVPLTYNAADVVEKVEWLIAHDELAHQIAINARNFGRSYLRLEDQFCYALTALEQIALVMNNTDALAPFDPLRVTMKSWLP
eukprot:gene8455-11433_t